jgi:hypothetical protein
MKNSVPYFLKLFNAPAQNNCVCYYDFEKTGTFIQNTSGNTGYMNGQIMPTFSNFWQNSGSGLFSGNYVKIITTGDINLMNATYAMVYEKTCNGGATLISTIESGYNSSGLYYKGFEFGVTSNNYLYFDYYTNNGPTTLIADKNISDKASVFLSIDNGSVSFGNYDFFTSKLNSNIFSIQNNYLLNPTGVNLGYNNDFKNTYCYNKKFTGYMDEFLIFSPPLYTYELVYLNSGFVYDYIPSTSYTEYTYATGITGYTTGVTGYYTFTNGYSVVATGTVTDIFGNTYTGYQAVPLNVTMSGTGILALTGITAFPSTSISGETVVFNSGTVASFGKNYINLLNKITTNDIVDICLPDQNFPYQYKNNINAKYDNVNNSFYDNDLKSNTGIGYIVYANGLAQNLGDSINTGTIYNTSLVIKNDYIKTTNNDISFANNFNDSDNITFQTVTGIYDTGLYIENFTVPSKNTTTVKNLVSYSNSFDKWFGYVGMQYLPRNMQKNATDPFGVANNAWSFPITGCTPPGGGFYNQNRTELFNLIPNGTKIISSMWIKTDNPTGFDKVFGINANMYGVPYLLTNQWQRITYTGNLNNTSSDQQLFFNAAAKTLDMTGTIYVYGAQIETGTTQLNEYIENSGTGVSNFISLNNLNWDSNKYNIFYNGQKLLTGNYNNVSNQLAHIVSIVNSKPSSGIYFTNNSELFSGTTGQLFALPRNFNSEVTGIFNLYKNLQRFYNNYSEVYLNGLRQSLGDEYLELAAYDLNTGSGIFDIKYGLLYNNNNI